MTSNAGNTSVQKGALALLLVAALLAQLACSDSSPAGPVDGASPPSDAVSDQGAVPDQGIGPDLAQDGGRPAACLDQDAKLQAALDAARKSPNALLVIRNVACGTTVYISGRPSSASKTSLWRIASVTKTYVAATILTLVRDGKLALNDLLSKWVPGVPNTDGVSVKMLLNHTSGIYDYVADATYLQNPSKTWTPAEMVAMGAKHNPYFAPGMGWHYSNTNYILLGMIAEKAGGGKASALIRQRVLVPAGLHHTFFEGEETLNGTLATGYDENENDITHAFAITYSSGWTDGAMAATGADVCEWIHALLATTKVLTVAERPTMLDAVSAGATMKYGLGVMVLDPSTTLGAGPAQGHSGANPGFYTQAYWFPDKQTGICAFTNQDGTDPNDLTVAARKVLFGS
jgi:D-alanyl-D-alanine carboxypeptidase